MAEYAIVDNGTIVDFRGFDTAPVALVGKPYRSFLPVEVTNPPYDPATQVKTGPVVTVLVDKVTRVWTVRDKTAAELDAEKDAAISNVDVVQFKLAFNHENRIRVLEGKPQITVAQFKAAWKAVS